MKSDLDTHKLRGILKNFSEKYPKKAIHGTQNENVSGQYISNSKNVHESYNIRECWDISYCDRMAHAKNCMDISSLGEGLEWAYDSVSIGINTNNCLFSFTAVINCQNVMYCDTAYSAKNAFGCVCLKQSENMILNKSYTKHEYDQKVGKIIDHMMSAGEWGEFFPLNISPFDYHESVAAEQYSLSRDEAQKLSVNWSHDPEIKGFS